MPPTHEPIEHMSTELPCRSRHENSHNTKIPHIVQSLHFPEIPSAPSQPPTDGNGRGGLTKRDVVSTVMRGVGRWTFANCRSTSWSSTRRSTSGTGSTTSRSSDMPTPGSRMPPVTVYEVDGRWVLADGFHRHAAAVMLGRRSIPAEVREGSMAEALDFVASVNLFHGLPLTRHERRTGGRGEAPAPQRLVGPQALRGAGDRPRADRQDPQDAGRGRPDLGGGQPGGVGRQDVHVGRAPARPERAAAEGQGRRRPGRPARSRVA